MTRHWKEDAVDVTWVDIDGDGWCDAITSGDIEPYKNAKGKPALLFEPGQSFCERVKLQALPENMITGEYEGSSFTVYWDTESTPPPSTRAYGKAISLRGWGPATTPSFPPDDARLVRRSQSRQRR